MQRRKRILGAVVGAGVFALTAACSSPGGGGGGGGGEGDWSIPEEAPTATIQVLSHLQDNDEQVGPVLDAFEEAYPSITVEFESVPFDQLNSVLEARITAKDGNPDVYWADMPRIAALSARGYTVDLTEQFEPYRDAWDEASYEGASAEGRLMGVPIANSTQLLFYNKDLLEQAGLEEPSADPESRITWEQLAQDARAAVDAGAKNGLVFGQVDRYYQLQPLPMSLGGSAGGTGEGNLTPDITSDAWAEAMDWYGSIFEEGISPRGVAPEQNDPAFLAGETAYQVQGPWLLPSLQASDVNWGVALHPYFEGGEPVTPTGSWALSMNPFSEEKEAAAIFMKWMSVDDGSGYTTNGPTPELPANIEGKTAYYARDVFTASEEGEKAAEIIDFETSNTAVNRLQTVGYVEFEEILGRAFADIRNGADPAEALENASTELETAWAAYK
jgi:ABC-type glycerol-3-phosphate transport system substrate-binding protein